MCEFYADEINTPCVKARAGDIRVPLGDALRPISRLSAEQILQVRTDLESRYGEACAMHKIQEGEDGLRKMLRAIRCWLGPNDDCSLAVDWPVLCLVVPEVRVVWKDSGQEKEFCAKVSCVDDWLRWVDAEVALFRCNLWRVTWGKINLRPDVRAARCGITRLNKHHKLGQLSFEPLVNNLGDNQFLSVFFFGPKKGKGKLPDGGLPFALDEPIKNGSYAVWLPASEERMRTRGRFGGLACFRKGKGLAHEFWHVVRHLLTQELSLDGKIFIPVIDGTSRSRKQRARQDFQTVKNEVADLAIDLTPQIRLEEYYATWPTSQQARAVAQRYGGGQEEV